MLKEMLTLVFIASFACNVHAQHNNCRKHGESADGCGFCFEEKISLGQMISFTFPWVNVSGDDVIIRKEPNPKLEIFPGQRAAQIVSTSNFGGAVKDSVVWFSFGKNSFATVVPKGNLMPFVALQGAFGLRAILSDYKIEEPAIVLRLTAEISEYDFDARQAGNFKLSTQCIIFYKLD